MIKKRKILIVIADYYSGISNSLLDSAKKTLIKPFKLQVITVPGVFEIPVIISKNIKKFDAFIALGCVIKGETPHFDFISKASIEAIMNLSVENKKPIGNGIITCLNMKQAIARKNNKGKEAANAVNSFFDVLQLDNKDMLVDF
jgi:6,7-dimethyl-8-ribityllumazine synthase